MDPYCDEFLNNPGVNPRTGRKITPTGKIYKSYMKDCYDHPRRPSVFPDAPPPPVPRPNIPLPTVNIPLPRPNIPVPTVNIPLPRPNIPVPTVSIPLPRPNIPVPRPNIPVPRPNIPVPRPNIPIPRPNIPIPRPNIPIPRPNIPLPRPNIPLPTVNIPSPPQQILPVPDIQRLPSSQISPQRLSPSQHPFFAPTLPLPQISPQIPLPQVPSPLPQISPQVPSPSPQVPSPSPQRSPSPQVPSPDPFFAPTLPTLPQVLNISPIKTSPIVQNISPIQQPLAQNITVPVPNYAIANVTNISPPSPGVLSPVFRERYSNMEIDMVDLDTYSVAQQQQRSSEDRYQVAQLGPYRYYAVFDGHGKINRIGPILANHAANYASEHLHEYLAEALRQVNLNETNLVATTIRDTFIRFDQDMLRRGVQSGTTCTVVLIDDELGVVYQVNIGDSKSIIFDDNQILSATTEHNATIPEEAQRALEGGASVQNGRISNRYMSLAVSRAFGDYEFKNGRDPLKYPVIADPEIIITDKVNSRILLTSDAPYERQSFDDESLVQLARRQERVNRDPSYIVDTLVEVIAPLVTDDVTIIYVLV